MTESEPLKAVLIIVGSLGGLYAFVGLIQFIWTVIPQNHAGGGAEIAASIVPVCVGSIICAFCFQKALRKL